MVLTQQFILGTKDRHLENDIFSKEILSTLHVFILMKLKILQAPPNSLLLYMTHQPNY